MKLNIEQLEELDHFIKYNIKDGGTHDKKALWRLYCNCQSFEATQTLKEFIIDHPYGYSTNGDVISHVQSFSLSLYTVVTIGRFACIWDPPKMTPLELHINFGNHLFANKDADAKNFSLAALNVNYKNSSFDAYDMFVMRALKDSWAFNKNPLLHYQVDSYYPNRKDIPKILKIRTIGLLFILADLANGFEGIYIQLVKLLISKYSRYLTSYAYASKIMIDIFKIYDLVYRFSQYRATTKGQDNFLLQRVERLMKKDTGFRAFIFKIVLVDQINCSNNGRDPFAQKDEICYYQGAFNYRVKMHNSAKYAQKWL